MGIIYGTTIGINTRSLDYGSHKNHEYGAMHATQTYGRDEQRSRVSLGFSGLRFLGFRGLGCRGLGFGA